MSSLRILSIVGSPRPNSRVRIIIEDVRHVLGRGYGVENPVWYLGENPLPFVDPDGSGWSDSTSDDLGRYIDLVRSSDGYVLGSPIYHNSFSGWLKNALDHASSREFGGKAFGLVSHGGVRSTQAVDHLRIVVRGVLGTAIPTQICTDDTDMGPDGSGRLVITSAPIRDRIERFGGELVEFTKMLKDRRERATAASLQVANTRR